MCGIAVGWGPDAVSAVAQALQRISHRGQDGTAQWSCGHLTMGFCRLAINDFSEAGMQPFFHGAWAGVFNGEIYNHQELTQAFGLTRHSGSDLEVVLPLWERLGDGVMAVLDGFFSGMMLNRETGEKWFLRDSIGKKPLFYVRTALLEGICSELKAFPEITRFQVIPPGLSRMKGEEVETVREHRLPPPIGSLREALTEAVRKRIPPDHPRTGVWLSGGLDSAIVAALALRTGAPLTLYALADPGSPDWDYVQEFSAFYGGLDIRRVPLPPAHALDPLIDACVLHTESWNPSVISNGLAGMLLAQAARQDGIRVVLTGDGADEVFCGYRGFRPENWQQRRARLLQDLHTTELRRLDAVTMAHTVEARCPFLDRQVMAHANGLSAADFFLPGETRLNGKAILRRLFAADLPPAICNRSKTSFDVGSGIRGKVVTHLTSGGETERGALRQRWRKYFPAALENHPYMHAYPVFDADIDRRTAIHTP